VTASDRASVGHGEESRKFGRASLALSVAGIVIGGAAIIAVIVTSKVYHYGDNSNNNYNSDMSVSL